MTDVLGRLTAALADRYAIERELGAGGMATVYLAHDVRHDRKVALKVLRPELSAILGAERFLTEIKTTANLQHPHILSLFDSGEADGLVFYVMPYVEGESLRDRLTREKQLPVEEAVRIAVEVAGALDYAHRHGVVHRDIKPENILLHEGQALVADFGIALAASRSDGGTRMTETGMSLGTPHYMAPEQAMGEKEITPKADVYALGCVLYEMLTAEPPFTGATAQAIIARVMTEEPRSLTLQRRTIPPHVEAATRKALEKLPADRFATAGQFADALTKPEFALPTTRAMEAAAPLSRRRRLLAAVPWALFAVTAALLAWALVTPAPRRVTRERLDLWKGAANPGAVAFRLAISPDGSTIVYVDSLGGQLMSKLRDQLDATPLTGTVGAVGPVFSPDGQWIAFDADGKLKKVSRLGGSPITLADSAQMRLPSIAWLDDGTIAYTDHNFDLMVVGKDGGPTRRLTRADSSAHGVAGLTPLPGGRALGAWCTAGCVDLSLVVFDFHTGRRTSVVDDAYKGWFLPDRRLVFVRRDGGVFAAPFDLKKLAFRSSPAPVFDGVRTVVGGADMALGADGTLIYAAGAAGATENPYQVVRVDRRGTATVVDTSWAFQTGIDFGIALSPDGRRLALGLSVNHSNDIYVKQLPTGPLTRLTFGGINERPEWTADGRTIMYAYRTASSDTARVRARLADGVGAETTLVRIKRGVFRVERTLDPRRLILRLGVPLSRDIVAYTLGADSAQPLMANDHYQEVAPALSPDGKWLAYASDESGRYEVFVRPYPDVNAGRWQVSANGGTEPQWSHNGRELFYRDASDGFMSAQVLPGPTFGLGTQTRLFSATGYEHDYVDRVYAVLPGDSGFLFVRLVQAQGAQVASSLVLVENWFQDLERGRAGRQ